jgi:hypothetical protein
VLLTVGAVESAAGGGGGGGGGGGAAGELLLPPPPPQAVMEDAVKAKKMNIKNDLCIVILVTD